MKRGRDNQERRRLHIRSSIPTCLFHQQVFRLEGEVGGGAGRRSYTHTHSPGGHSSSSLSVDHAVFFFSSLVFLFFKKYKTFSEGIVLVELLPFTDRSSSAQKFLQRFPQLPNRRRIYMYTCRCDCMCVTDVETIDNKIKKRAAPSDSKKVPSAPRRDTI